MLVSYNKSRSRYDGGGVVNKFNGNACSFSRSSSSFRYSDVSGGKYRSLGNHSRKNETGVMGGQSRGNSRFAILEEISEEVVVIYAKNNGKGFKSAKANLKE
ncbi:hypothetical protein ACOSP7_028625 [Xanthoceras sorbifolium]